MIKSRLYKETLDLCVFPCIAPCEVVVKDSLTTTILSSSPSRKILFIWQPQLHCHNPYYFYLLTSATHAAEPSCQRTLSGAVPLNRYEKSDNVNRRYQTPLQAVPNRRYYQLTVGIVTQTMKHLVIAHFLISTEPLQVLALVLGSELANHWGIVLAFFIYVHLCPKLKIRDKGTYSF